MRYLLIFLLIFFTACSAKYKVVKEYTPPQTEGEADKICISLCQTKQTACQTKCRSEFETCKIEADKIAEKNYEDAVKLYTTQLEAYVNNMSNINISYMYDPFFYDPYYNHESIFLSGYPYHYGPYPKTIFHQSAPMQRKPRKPSLEREKLKSQMKLCNIDCGCKNSYDGCFRGCGGIISHKKICIENCPD